MALPSRSKKLFYGEQIMVGMITELLIDPIFLDGKSLETPIHVTKEGEFFQTLMDFLDKNNCLAWIILLTGGDEKICFLKKTDGTINDKQGKEIIFFENQDKTLSFAIKE